MGKSIANWYRKINKVALFLPPFDTGVLSNKKIYTHTGKLTVPVPSWTIKKTGVDGWGNGGSASQLNPTSGDCSFDVVYTTSDGNNRAIGFAKTYITSPSYNTFTHMIYLFSTNVFQVYEGNSGAPVVGASGSAVNGDKFSCVKTGTTITYLKNNSLFYTSLVASNVPVHLDIAIYNNLSILHGIRFYDRGTEVPIMWTSGNLATLTAI